MQSLIKLIKLPYTIFCYFADGLDNAKKYADADKQYVRSYKNGKI